MTEKMIHYQPDADGGITRGDQVVEGSDSGYDVRVLDPKTFAFVTAVASGQIKIEQTPEGWAQPNTGQLTGEVHHKKFGDPNYLGSV